MLKQISPDSPRYSSPIRLSSQSSIDKNAHHPTTHHVNHPRPLHVRQRSRHPPGVSEVIRLLRNWDRTDDETHAYLQAFSADATLNLPPNKVTGHDAIRAMRNSIIHPVNGPVTHVAHTFYRVYIMAGNEGNAEKTNISFTGSVDYTVRGGSVVTQLFSTTFDLIAVGKDEYKVQFATIYSDNVPLMAAMAEMGPAKEEGDERKG